jgi:hypothetical protein
MKKKKLTNIQKIKEIMEFSNYGALSQVFVMEALYREADRISKTDPSQYDKGKWCFIDPEAWVGVAKEIKDKIDNHFHDKEI